MWWLHEIRLSSFIFRTICEYNTNYLLLDIYFFIEFFINLFVCLFVCLLVYLHILLLLHLGTTFSEIILNFLTLIICLDSLYSIWCDWLLLTLQRLFSYLIFYSFMFIVISSRVGICRQFRQLAEAYLSVSLAQTSL